LPDEAAAPPATQIVEEAVQPPQPEEMVKPDIVLPDKKKVEPKPVVPKRVEKKPVVIGKIGNISDEIGKVGKISAIGVVDQKAAQATREQADKAALAGRVVDEYTARISAKIRNEIGPTPGVADDARAVYLVTVLPGGTVLPPRLLQSSGYEAYDNAVERAILKAQPLPLPPDPSMFNKFRELELKFSPKDKKR